MPKFNDNDAIPQLRPSFIRYVSDAEYFRARGQAVRVKNNPTRTQLVNLTDAVREQLQQAPADVALQAQYEDMLCCLAALEGEVDGYTLKTWYLEEHVSGKDRPTQHELSGAFREVREGRNCFRMASPPVHLEAAA